MNRAKILMSVSAILVAACATPLKPNQVGVVFNTQPPGAMLYDGRNGTAWGQAPQGRMWTFNSKEGANAGDTATVIAVWPSGAKKTEYIRIQGSAYSGAYTISRPVDAPGLAQDLEYAQRISAEEVRAAAARSEAAESLGKALGTAFTGRGKAPSVGGSINCIHTGITTTCY